VALGSTRSTAARSATLASTARSCGAARRARCPSNAKGPAARALSFSAESRHTLPAGAPYRSAAHDSVRERAGVALQRGRSPTARPAEVRFGNARAKLVWRLALARATATTLSSLFLRRLAAEGVGGAGGRLGEGTGEVGRQVTHSVKRSEVELGKREPSRTRTGARLADASDALSAGLLCCLPTICPNGRFGLRKKQQPPSYGGGSLRVPAELRRRQLEKRRSARCVRSRTTRLPDADIGRRLVQVQVAASPLWRPQADEAEHTEEPGSVTSAIRRPPEPHRAAASASVSVR
jgi:hypothetical protein